VKKKVVRKLVLNLDTLRWLDPADLGRAEGAHGTKVDPKADTATCASNRPCTGCVPCQPTG